MSSSALQSLFRLGAEIREGGYVPKVTQQGQQICPWTAAASSPSPVPLGYDMLPDHIEYLDCTWISGGFFVFFFLKVSKAT